LFAPQKVFFESRRNFTKGCSLIKVHKCGVTFFPHIRPVNRVVLSPTRLGLSQLGLSSSWIFHLVDFSMIKPGSARLGSARLGWARLILQMKPEPVVHSTILFYGQMLC